MENQTQQPQQQQQPKTLNLVEADHLLEFEIKLTRAHIKVIYALLEDVRGGLAIPLHGTIDKQYREQEPEKIKQLEEKIKADEEAKRKEQVKNSIKERIKNTSNKKKDNKLRKV